MTLLLKTCVILLLLSGAASAGTCVDTRVDLRDNGSAFRFAIEIADDNAERALGLMNRPDMPQFSGMLFAYDSPRRMTFWMKNTLIPLDMLFIDATGTVMHIRENAVPLSLETISGGDNIQFVLEINGGLARNLGISLGAELRHAIIPQENAVWPCE